MWTSSCQPNAGVYIPPAFRGLASSNMARGRHEAAPAVSVGGAQVAYGVPYTLPFSSYIYPVAILSRRSFHRRNSFSHIPFLS